MNNNPLISNERLPGAKFQLPSLGLFYKDGELDPSVDNGEVHVHAMTAYDEILIKTPDLLLSGEAIEKVFARCIPEINKPLRLLSRDVDFLMICLRSVSFGSVVEVDHKHDCTNAKDHPYGISIEDFITRTKMMDPTMIEQQYTLQLDDKLIHFSPLRYVDLIEILNFDTKDLTVEQIHNETAKQITNLITSIAFNETIITQFDLILEWIKQLPIQPLKKINKHLSDLEQWGTDMVYQIECKDCSQTINVSIPLNPMHFFT